MGNPNLELSTGKIQLLDKNRFLDLGILEKFDYLNFNSIY